MADVTVTTANVTNLLGITGEDQATTHAALITRLIDSNLKLFLELTGRSAEKVTATTQIFNDGIECDVVDEDLWLKGKYSDILSISAITNEGNSLSESVAYADGNNFVIDKRLGKITRVDGSAWSKEVNAILITGYFGIGTIATADFTLRADAVQTITEMICTASGLWTQLVMTPEGNIESTIVQFPKITKDSLARFKIKK